MPNPNKNKDDAIAEVRRILEKSGIPKEVVDQWMAHPREAAENQKTEVLVMIKDKLLELSNLVNQQQLDIIEIRKQITELNAWKWRQEKR